MKCVHSFTTNLCITCFLNVSSSLQGHDPFVLHLLVDFGFLYFLILSLLYKIPNFSHAISTHQLRMIIGNVLISHYQLIKMLSGGGSPKPEQNWYISIIRKIDQLNLQNQRLISIADHITKTSFMQGTPITTPAVITQIQEDMRASFNALIQGIREYFIVIDEKLKQIGKVIQSKVLEERPVSRNGSSAQLTFLAKRVQLLQENLRKTSMKEEKLINIIGQMAQNNSFFQESFTSSSKGRMNGPPQIKRHHESSIRIFAGKEQNPTREPLNSVRDAYPRPYSIVDMQPSQPKFHREHSPLNFCMMQPADHSIRPIPLPKRSLKVSKELQQEAASNQHRMSYLMRVLKN